MSDSIRVLGLLVGDIHRPSSAARIKYGQFFDALGEGCTLAAVRDVEPRGLPRLFNALRTATWPARRWRERMYKNPRIFAQRSDRAREYIDAYGDNIDVVLQLGATFSAYTGRAGPPLVVYTDFTYRLSRRFDPWRDPFTRREERRQWDALEAQTYRDAAFILTRSAYVRRSIVDDYSIAPERVAVVGAGVNFDRLPETPATVEHPRVLFIGKEFQRKGGDILVAAFEGVRGRLPESELWLVTADDCPAGRGIRALPPTHDRRVIAEYYRDAGVFAMPSRSETWGDVFLEAMAHGVPCIGADQQAMPEIIVDGETGYLVTPGDVAGLAEVLERLLGDPNLRRQMGYNGRRRVASHFTWTKVVQRMTPYLKQATIDTDESNP